MLDARNFLKEAGISETTIEEEVNTLLKKHVKNDLSELYAKSFQEIKPNTILKGKVVNIIKDEVLVDVGYKSEGILPLSDFDDPAEVKVGNEIDVLMEEVEDDSGRMVISKNKADRIRGWEKVINTCKEGDSIKGRVIRKVKGGLLVNVGMLAFLPASQLDIRHVDDISKFIGKEIETKIIQIDQERMSVVISRKKLLEDQRAEQREKLLSELKENDICSGVVKNITDFGAFIDLGGMDGLLHITDMAWHRISHPSEMLKLDQHIKVKIIKIDRTTNRITLGLKQLTPDPWEKVEQKYAVGSHIKGKIVNIVPYGAFVEVESGVEGLLHLSELSWTKRLTHPSEMVAIGDIIEAVVLKVDGTKKELSLGMKQLETNPWTQIQSKYPAGTRIQGRVRNLTSYGAFIEIEEGVDGLLHLSDISWTKKAFKPLDLIKKGDKIEVVVLSVDPEKKKVALGLKQLTPNPWETIIPQKYNLGAVIKGKVIRTYKNTTLVELEPEVAGVLTMTKLTDKPAEGGPLKPDKEITVEVTRLRPDEGEIWLKLYTEGGSPVAKEEIPLAPLTPPTEGETEKKTEGTTPS